MKKGKKIMIAVISIVLVIVLAFGIGVGFLYAFGDKIIIGKTEVKEFTTQNENSNNSNLISIAPIVSKFNITKLTH